MGVDSFGVDPFELIKGVIDSADYYFDILVLAGCLWAFVQCFHLISGLVRIFARYLFSWALAHIILSYCIHLLRQTSYYQDIRNEVILLFSSNEIIPLLYRITQMLSDRGYRYVYTATTNSTLGGVLSHHEL